MRQGVVLNPTVLLCPIERIVALKGESATMRDF